MSLKDKMTPKCLELSTTEFPSQLGLRYIQAANVFDWTVFGLAFAFAWDINLFKGALTETREIEATKKPFEPVMFSLPAN